MVSLEMETTPFGHITRRIPMVKIISDSTCDLSRELQQQYDIDILPLHIILGANEYDDGFGITPEELYRWSDETKQTPKTSACSVDEAMAMFDNYLSNGSEIVCFSISESMSSTCNNMRLAAQKLGAADRVFVIDSANLSTGVGLLVIEAALMAHKGMSGREIADAIEAIKPLVRASFVVDTLTYLHRGGRCSGAAALVGSTLKLHPRIAVADGKMSPGKKYRGRMSRAIMDYVRDMEPALLKAKTDRVFITHSGCKDEDLAAVRSYLEGLNRFEEILTTRAGSVISSHCGPGTLGVLFIDGE